MGSGPSNPEPRVLQALTTAPIAPDDPAFCALLDDVSEFGRVVLERKTNPSDLVAMRGIADDLKQSVSYSIPMRQVLLHLLFPDNFELVKAGSSLRLQIFSNEEKIGQLEVGRGSLYWNGRNRKSRERVDWSRFADMMDELAYGK